MNTFKDTNHAELYRTPIRGTALILYNTDQTYKYSNANCQEAYSDSGNYFRIGSVIRLQSKINKEDTTFLNDYIYRNMTNKRFIKSNGRLISKSDTSFILIRTAVENNKKNMLDINGNGFLILIDSLKYDNLEFGMYRNYNLYNGYKINLEKEVDTIKNGKKNNS